MKTNVGSYDAAARFLLGCGLLFMSVNGLGWWSLLGVLPILSAACGYCGLYHLCGINTAAWEEAHEPPHGPPPPARKT